MHVENNSQAPQAEERKNTRGQGNKERRTYHQLHYVRKRIWESRDEEEQRRYIRQAIRVTYGFTAREGQVEALWRLAILKQDLLLAAKTSFGKSVIFQLLPLLFSNGIILIILPLNAIGEDQRQKIEELPGASPMLLRAENNTVEVRQKIRQGAHTHVLLSPEIACSLEFKRQVLDFPEFKSRVRAVAVDEVHLTVDWGKCFRKSYAMLRNLRQSLGDRPWFGCSATLDRETLASMEELRIFKHDAHTLRTSVDRPEISYVRKIIPKRKKWRFHPLYFLLDGAVSSATTQSHSPTTTATTTTTATAPQGLITTQGLTTTATMTTITTQSHNPTAATTTNTQSHTDLKKTIPKTIIFF